MTDIKDCQQYEGGV